MRTAANAVLACALQPDDLARKTYRAICALPEVVEDGYIKIGDREYHILIMEDTYDENYQIGANEGDIVVFDFVTCGLGEVVAWDDLLKQKAQLEEWAKVVCAELNCTARFFVTANRW